MWAWVAACLWQAQAQPRPEPLGPSTRKTGLVFSEIMFRPAPRADSLRPEFIEIHNSNPYFEEVSGCRLVFNQEVRFVFPAGTVIPAGGFLVAAAHPSEFRRVYTGVTNTVYSYGSSLYTFDMLQLISRDGAVLLNVPWPEASANPILAGAMAGHSLVLARPSYGEASPLAWGISDVIGGSPGGPEPGGVEPLRRVVINEVRAPQGEPRAGFVELYNHSKVAADLSGASLSDSPARLTNGFRIPAGTVLEPRGFVFFAWTNLGFSGDWEGGAVYLAHSNGTRVIDAFPYGAQAAGVSTGRFPDGAGDCRPLEAQTPGGPNSRFITSSLMINELMFNPLGMPEDQYVELYNGGDGSVSLAGWELTGFGGYRFPADAVIGPKDYMVVACNATNLFSHHASVLDADHLYGDGWAGRLSSSGERVRLRRPVVTAREDGDDIDYSTNYVTVDEVTYAGGGQWGLWCNQGGSSLELRDPRADHRRADNWADSDETAKAGWITVEATGLVEAGQVYKNQPVDDIQVILLGEDECLVDDVEVSVAPGGPNLVANPGFENGLEGWVFQGDHSRSRLETSEGFQSARSLHVRAGARGDTGANRARGALASPVVPGQTVTLRARVRWLCGWPEIVLRLRGNYLEASARFEPSAGLGTPGRRNSRAVSNAGPAIDEAAHWPVLPGAGEAVVVTARLDDPDGVAGARLNYRLDPATQFSSVPMTDDGAGGDDVAGDGIYSATLPGQPAGVLAAFHVEAWDNASPSVTNRFPREAPERECLARFGDPRVASHFGTYRFWMTQKAFEAWTAREVLSNERIEGAFVYGDCRVVYAAGGRYAGSPNHQNFDSPAGKPCHYSFDLPAGDQLLGSPNLNKIHAPGNAPFDDPTIQTEQTAYWIARQIGLPANYKRYVVLFVNGARRGTLMEDTQVPSRQVLSEWFPGGSEGPLFKLQPWYEFDNTTSGRMDFTNVSGCTLNCFSRTGGLKDQARYRWHFLPRAAEHTANDYSEVFDLIDAFNTPTNGPYGLNLERLVDVEQWMRTFAVQHAAGNWDCFGGLAGQNTYAFKSAVAPWRLLIWDFEVVLGNSFSDGPAGDDLFKSNPADPMLARLYRHLPARRAYWRAIKEIVEGPLVASRVNPVLDAKYAVFSAEGLGVADPAGVKAWLAARRVYLSNCLQAVSTPFWVDAPDSFTTSNNLLTLAGSAPVEARSVRINGVEYPTEWTSETNWRVRVALSARSNYLAVVGFDRTNRALYSCQRALRAYYEGPLLSPTGRVVINEIMFRPGVSGAGFVELLNTATNFAFDLSGWSLRGAGLAAPFPGFSYEFPSGRILAGGEALAVTEDRRAFAQAYGAGVPVEGVFAGLVSPDGAVVTLRSSPTNGPNVVARFRYEGQPPWAALAAAGPLPTPLSPMAGCPCWMVSTRPGFSIQLRDPLQDSGRAGNWILDAPATPAAANSVRAGVSPFPPLWLNEVQAVNLTGITPRSGRPEPWIELYNGGPDPLSLDGCYLAGNYTNLLQWALPAGRVIPPAGFLLVWADGQASVPELGEWHAGFRLGPGAGAVVLSRLAGGRAEILDYLNYPDMPAGSAYGGYPDGQASAREVFARATPGAANSAPLELFINEWMPANHDFLADPADGDFEDWFELYNASSHEEDLSGFLLTDVQNGSNYWRIPAGTVLPARGFLLVWADSETNQNRPARAGLHASFRLNRDGDRVELRLPDTNLVDAVSFGPQTNNISQGRYPDGGTGRVVFAQTPTPGEANRADGLFLSMPGLATVEAGQTLRFRALVPGVPSPPYLLKYALGPGAPPGAVLNSRTGEFSWTPEAAQAPSLNQAAVRVINHGAPAFDLAGVAVVVVPGPARCVGFARFPGGGASLEFQCTPLRAYRLEACDDLGRGQWESLGEAAAGESSLVFDVPVSEAGQRFFRLRQLE